jgi:hypothetical protein
LRRIGNVAAVVITAAGVARRAGVRPAAEPVAIRIILRIGWTSITGITQTVAIRILLIRVTCVGTVVIDVANLISVEVWTVAQIHAQQFRATAVSLNPLAGTTLVPETVISATAKRVAVANDVAAGLVGAPGRPMSTAAITLPRARTAA